MFSTAAGFSGLVWLCCECNNTPYLLLICAVQVSPLLNWLCQVKGVHGYFNLSNDIVFGEAIKVIHRHYQSLPSHLLEWYLKHSSQSSFTHLCRFEQIVPQIAHLCQFMTKYV